MKRLFLLLIAGVTLTSISGIAQANVLQWMWKHPIKTFAGTVLAYAAFKVARDWYGTTIERVDVDEQDNIVQSDKGVAYRLIFQPYVTPRYQQDRVAEIFGSVGLALQKQFATQGHTASILLDSTELDKVRTVIIAPQAPAH